MARTLLTDTLWKRIELHLPDPKPSPKGGRPRVSNRSTVAGILFVLRHGLPWRDLPLELGYGSGITCWRRLVAWQSIGTWDRAWQAMLAALNKDDRLLLERAALDASAIPAQKRGRLTGPNPVDRGKAGSKHHIIVDRQGIPLAALVSPSNSHDSKAFEQTLDAIKPIAGKAGEQRRRPSKVHADKGYDFPRCRQAGVARGIVPRIARRGVESKERLGRYRWVVERTFAWLHAFRRLRIRYERRNDIHLAFLILGCLIITARFLDC